MTYTDADLSRDIEFIAKRAEGGKPEDGFDRTLWEMARVHLALMRHWVQVQKRFKDYPADDAENYLGFSLAWVGAVRKHHQLEEEVQFPVINEKYSMQHNHDQHEELLVPLSAFADWLEQVKAGSAEWKSEHAEKFAQDLLPPLMKHLTEELDTLEPEVMKKNGIVLDDLIKVGQQIQLKAKDILDPPSDVVAYILHNDDRLDWPVVPWQMTPEMKVPPPLFDIHKGWWKYAPQK